MRTGRPIGRAFLASAAFLGSACSAGIRQQYDADLDRNITHMSGNTVREDASLSEHTLQLNAARVEEAGEPSYALFAKSSGPGWVQHESLTLFIDGAPVTIHAPIQMDSEAICPSSASAVSLYTVADAGCVYEETYWFPTSSTVLKHLATAGEVSVRLHGANGTIARRFSAENFQKFKRFVSLYVDE